MNKNDNKITCPKCTDGFVDQREMRCGSCGYVPDSRDELWKEANMGKQRNKPIANRDGKK